MAGIHSFGLQALENLPSAEVVSHHRNQRDPCAQPCCAYCLVDALAAGLRFKSLARSGFALFWKAVSLDKVIGIGPANYNKVRLECGFLPVDFIPGWHCRITAPWLLNIFRRNAVAEISSVSWPIAFLALHPERISLRHFLRFPERRILERLDRVRPIEVDHCIELTGQIGTEVMAEAFGVRPV